MHVAIDKSCFPPESLIKRSIVAVPALARRQFSEPPLLAAEESLRLAVAGKSESDTQSAINGRSRLCHLLRPVGFAGNLHPSGRGLLRLLQGFSRTR